MKIIHIESGLGNQMLSYCEYLAIKKMNSDEDVYIETIVFEIPECNTVVNQWNGYELQRIFGINAPNVRTLFTEKQWRQIIDEIKRREFWNNGWCYRTHFTEAFIHAGLPLKPPQKGIGKKIIPSLNPSWIERFKSFMGQNVLPYTYFREFVKRQQYERILREANYEFLFKQTDENLFIGQTLDFKNKNAGIERIADEIRDAFKFPDLSDSKNVDALKHIRNHNSVAIHARRGDMLGRNYGMYKTGYFKRAVRYIRGHMNSPVFYIFTDPGSVQWCMENAHILGLNPKKDEIHFVDWNKGEDSYKDMQLMAACKHQVITNSTFGWWGAYFNENPCKITCSPIAYINTTNTF